MKDLKASIIAGKRPFFYIWQSFSDDPLHFPTLLFVKMVKKCRFKKEDEKWIPNKRDLRVIEWTGKSVLNVTFMSMGVEKPKKVLYMAFILLIMWLRKWKQWCFDVIRRINELNILKLSIALFKWFLFIVLKTWGFPDYLMLLINHVENHWNRLFFTIKTWYFSHLDVIILVLKSLSSK